MKSDFMNSLEELGKSATEYADLKIDDLKLRTAKGLSVTLNRIILAVLFLSIAGIVLTSAAFGGILLIGKLIGSYAGGAFIVSAFFLLVLIALYLLRDRLFLNSLVKMFIRLFFEDK
ncbi:MAG TPA: hypothetical protein DHU72_02260 [Rikenellaceae bacterium]|nr:hypothetical protein [Rikenellaceae bacterium]HBH21455.1 hypothetical protein [Rikenellaceae bacterium]HCZ22305.1 hypothetical protein [Rikenellaceae bacterium]